MSLFQKGKRVDSRSLMTRRVSAAINGTGGMGLRTEYRRAPSARDGDSSASSEHGSDLHLWGIPH